MRRKNHRRSFKGLSKGERRHATMFGRVPVHRAHDHTGNVGGLLPRRTVAADDAARMARIDSKRKARSIALVP